MTEQMLPEVPAERRERLKDVLIVDADVHVHETPRALIPYCDMPWRKALEAIQHVPERYLDIPGFSAGTSPLTAAWPTTATVRVVAEPADMRAELDALDVDLGILFPDNLLTLPLLVEEDYAAALARAYNRWLVAEWASQESGLLGCIVACPQDPADAALEIERHAAEPGIVGVYLPCAGLDRLWGDRKYHPILAAAESAGLPVLLHSVTVLSSRYPFNNEVYNTEFGRHVTSHTFSIMANLVHMVTNGTMVRFPNLRIGVLEAGLSWMPFLMQRMDKEYLERRREVPFLAERPSTYLKRVYVATQPIEEPEDLRDVVKVMELYDGEDTTIFASDWPHHDFDHPMKIDQIPFTEAARRKVFGENALRLFNIDATGRRLQG